MKRLTLFIFLMVSISIHFAQAKGFAADTVKVGFQKDIIRILEGESKIIVIELNGEIPKDSVVEVKWKIIDSDATSGIDYKILGDENFTFLSNKSAIQEKYFKILTYEDENIENEKFTIELSFVLKGKSFAKLINKKYVVILTDTKTELQAFKEKYIEQEKEILKTLSDVINNDKNVSDTIGIIRLISTPQRLHYWRDSKKNSGYKSDLNKDDDKLKEIDISKVDIRFKYGVATDIRAFAKDNSEVFSNHWYNGREPNRPRYGVSYRHNAISSRNKKYYLIGEKNPSKFIKLVDLIDYENRTGLNFAPSDTMITLLNEKGKEEANILVRAFLNSYINFNIYTDLLGLLRIDQGNGIIQSDASAKIFLSTLPAKDKLRFHFNYLMPYARLARFENGFQNVPTTDNDTTSFGIRKSKSDNISRMLLNQRKVFDVGLKLNILNKIGKFDNTYELNTFAGFGWFRRQGPVDNELTQKLNGVKQYQGILTNTLEFGLETRAAILQYKNFGINTGLLASWQKIINAKLYNIADGGFKPFYRTEAEIFYYPLEKSNDKIFLRTYYTFNNSQTEESFLRVQVGYKALFKISNKK